MLLMKECGELSYLIKSESRWLDAGFASLVEEDIRTRHDELRTLIMSSDKEDRWKVLEGRVMQCQEDVSNLARRLLTISQKEKTAKEVISYNAGDRKECDLQ